MAGAVGSSGSRKVPDGRCLAFAVSIVHSKPDELSIEEYIALLRQHVARGRRENALSAVHRHLDRSSYWRCEFERTKEALDAAEKEKLDLRLEIERMKAESGAFQSAVAAKKRKKPEDPDVIPVPRSPKKTKQAAPTNATTLTRFDVDAEFNFSHFGETGDVLMRSFYQAHSLLRSNAKADPASLAHHLVCAASAISDVLQQVAKQCITARGRNIESFEAVLIAASRAMQSLLVGYARVSNVFQGEQVQGHFVYAFVQILEKGLAIMSEFAKAEVSQADRDGGRPQARPSASKGKAKQAAEALAKVTPGSALDALTAFIGRSINLLDPKSDSHRPLFEGATYIVIEKLASRLYVLVFGIARGKSMEDDIAAAAEPDDIEDAEQGWQEKPGEIELKSAKLEAPHLVRLLTSLMRVAPLHFGASFVTKSSKGKGASRAAVLKDNLAITAKERLQRTLVNCMFGGEGTNDDDPFLDCLSKPVANGSLPAAPVVKEAEIQEWFKEEVWRLLGWDILTREDGW